MALAAGGIGISQTMVDVEVATLRTLNEDVTPVAIGRIQIPRGVDDADGVADDRNFIISERAGGAIIVDILLSFGPVGILVPVTEQDGLTHDLFGLSRSTSLERGSGPQDTLFLFLVLWQDNHSTGIDKDVAVTDHPTVLHDFREQGGRSNGGTGADHQFGIGVHHRGGHVLGHDLDTAVGDIGMTSVGHEVVDSHIVVVVLGEVADELTLSTGTSHAIEDHSYFAHCTFSFQILYCLYDTQIRCQ